MFTAYIERKLMNTAQDTLVLEPGQVLDPELDAWLARLEAEAHLNLDQREAAIAQWLDEYAPTRSPAWEDGFWDSIHGLRPWTDTGDYHDGWRIGYQFMDLAGWDQMSATEKASFYQDFPPAMVEKPNTLNLVARLAARGLA